MKQPAVLPRAGTAGAILAAAIGAVLLAIAGGAFSSLPPRVGPTVSSFVFHPEDPNIVYAATDVGIFKTLDRGGHWQPVNRGIPRNAVIRVLVLRPDRPDTLYAGIEAYEAGIKGLYRSTDAGASWEFLGSRMVPGRGHGFPEPAVARVLVIDPNDFNAMYAIASNGDRQSEIFKSTDAGVTWFPTYLGKRVSFSGLVLHPDNAQVLYAGANGGVILRTENGGRDWTEFSSVLYQDWPAEIRALGMSASDPGIMFASTGAGLFKSTNGGKSWSLIKSTCLWLGVSGLVPNVLFESCALRRANIDVDASLVQKSVDGGESWRTIGSGLPKDWRAHSITVAPRDPKVVFAGWAGGGVYRSLDGGETWESTSSGMTWADICKESPNLHACLRLR